MIKRFFLFLTLAVFIFAGCNRSKSSSNDDFYYSAAKNVAPDFTTSASTNPKIYFHSLSMGDPLYGTTLGAVYGALQDYVYPDDEGSIDMHNIYKVILTAGQIYPGAKQTCTAITEKEILSPFDLGVTAGNTYNCAGSGGVISDNYATGFAIKEDTDGTKYSLLTYKMAPTPDLAQGYGVLQGSYNDTTGALFLRVTALTYYPNGFQGNPDASFAIRTHISGNAQTNEFTLSTISNQPGATPKWISMVGKGISKGSDNHFLFKVKDADGHEGYFCFPASAILTDLESMNTAAPYGKDTVDTECAAYQSDVDFMAYSYLTSNDVPMKLDDFANSTIMLSY